MKKNLTFLFPLFAIVLWAGNVIVSRMSAHTIGPQAITFYRLLFAVSLMTMFAGAPAWRNRALLWRHFGQLAVLGFLAMCLFQSLSYLAAESTTATNMAVFTALTPLLTVALSSFLLGETATVGVASGGIVSLIGLLYLVSGGVPMSLIRDGMHLGDVLMFVAAIVYALYGVLLKRWSLPIPGWQSTYVQALCALAIMFPAVLATPAPMRALKPETLPLIAYAGGLASIVLPYFWIRGVEILGPSRSSTFLNLLPVLTATGAIVLLGEPVRLYHIIGGGVALAGVILAQAVRTPVRRQTVHTESAHQ